MNIRVNIADGKPYIELKYTELEHSKIQERMARLELIEQTTTDGFGMHVAYKYYQDRSRNLINWLDLKDKAIDDINTPMVKDGKVNIGIFRVIPNEHRETRVFLHNMLDIVEFERLQQYLSMVYRLIMSGIMTPQDIKIEVITK